MAAKKQYVATVALVIAKSSSGDLYLYQGVPVPESVSDEEVQRLLEGGFISEVKSGEPASAPVDEPVDPYKGKSSDELKAELATRNEGREDADKIVPADPGNKPEVLAALIADDEKSKQ
jgi:hypothetical protein